MDKNKYAICLFYFESGCILGGVKEVKKIYQSPAMGILKFEIKDYVNAITISDGYGPTVKKSYSSIDRLNS